MADSVDPETLMTIGLSVGLGSAALSAAIVIAILCCRHRCPRQKLSETRRGEKGKTHKNGPGFGPGYDNTGYSAGPTDTESASLDKGDIGGNKPEGSITPDVFPASIQTSDKPQLDEDRERERRFFYSESIDPDHEAMGTVRLHRSNIPIDIPSMERHSSDEVPSVERRRRDDGVASVERRLTFPPVLMVPFRSTLLSGRSLHARPSTIAGLPTSRQTADWGATAGSLYHDTRRASSRDSNPGSPTTDWAAKAGSVRNYTTSAEDILNTFSQSGSCRM